MDGVHVIRLIGASIAFIVVMNIIEHWGFSVFLTILAIGFALFVLWFFFICPSDKERRDAWERQEAQKAQEKMAKIRKCSSCGHPTSKIISERKRSYDTTRTETRRHTHYDTSHNETGYTETEYEVPDTRYVTDYTFKCDSCGHEWTY